MNEESTENCLRQVEYICCHYAYMFRSTFLHEIFNHRRFYELPDNDLDMPAMFLQIIKNVCRKIITSAANIWSTTAWICATK